jgi:TPR repeat protein
LLNGAALIYTSIAIPNKFDMRNFPNKRDHINSTGTATAKRLFCNHSQPAAMSMVRVHEESADTQFGPISADIDSTTGPSSAVEASTAECNAILEMLPRQDSIKSMASSLTTKPRSSSSSSSITTFINSPVYESIPCLPLQRLKLQVRGPRELMAGRVKGAVQGTTVGQQELQPTTIAAGDDFELNLKLVAGEAPTGEVGNIRSAANQTLSRMRQANQSLAAPLAESYPALGVQVTPSATYQDVPAWPAYQDPRRYSASAPTSRYHPVTPYMGQAGRIPAIPNYMPSTPTAQMAPSALATPMASTLFLPSTSLDRMLLDHNLSYPAFIAYLTTPELKLCFCEFIIKSRDCPPIAKVDALKMLKKLAQPPTSASGILPSAFGLPHISTHGMFTRNSATLSTLSRPDMEASGASSVDGVRPVSGVSASSTTSANPTKASAQFLLATCYQTGHLDAHVDVEKAFQLYHLAARGGHAEAMYRTGVCLELGAGTKRDVATAFAFYRHAAYAGLTIAIYKLATILLYGSRNMPTAPQAHEGMAWLARASQCPDVGQYPQILHELALIYEGIHPKVLSLGVQANQPLALDLFFQAGKFGYAPAQFKLGNTYEYGGLGLGVDCARALGWYVKAAEQQLPEAEMALSGWYLCGLEGILRQSDLEAFLWAQKAADQGHASAEYAVGYLLEHGIGVTEPSREMARKYYMRACAQGGRLAACRVIRESLSP